MESIIYHHGSLTTALRNAHIAHTSAVVEKIALVCAIFLKMTAAIRCCPPKFNSYRNPTKFFLVTNVMINIKK